jgi:hypothetical protein
MARLMKTKLFEKTNQNRASVICIEKRISFRETFCFSHYGKWMPAFSLKTSGLLLKIFYFITKRIIS